MSYDPPSPFGPVPELDLGPKLPRALIPPTQWFAPGDEPTVTTVTRDEPLAGQLPTRPAVLAVRAAAQKRFSGEPRTAGRALNSSQWQVLYEVARFRFMTYSLLSRVTGRSESTLRNCVTKHLVPRGLLEADEEQYFGQKVWRATETGLQSIASPLQPAPAIDLATYRYDLCTIDATATLISTLATGETLTTRAEWLSGRVVGADEQPIRVDPITTSADPVFPTRSLTPDAVIKSSAQPLAGCVAVLFQPEPQPVQWFRVVVRSYVCNPAVDSLVVISTRAVRELVERAVADEELAGFVRMVTYEPSAAVPFRVSDW